MLSFKRSERVREVMIHEISDIIRNELKDPRIGFVTVMDVELAHNLRHADVFVSPMGSEEEMKRTVNGIISAAPFIRRLLGQRMQIKFVPELAVKWDHTGEHSDRINRLLHTIHDGEEKKPVKPDNEE